MVVTLLAGGTGGAKLAVGLRDILHGVPGADAPDEPGQLHVVANTADDIEIYDAYVSPDPDLITFRLAGVLNAAGFGIEGESHSEMDRRRAAGEDIWLALGDDDIVVCRERAALLADGVPLTEAHARATAAYDTGGASVLPMTDDAVRTVVETPNGERGIQEYLIKDRSEPAIKNVRWDVATGGSGITPQVAAAIAESDLIVIGPSNPVISIRPILSFQVLEAIVDSGAPLLAVSPFVGGEILKGPTAKFLTAQGVSADSQGAFEYLRGASGDAIDAFVGDEPVTGIPHHLTDVRMSNADEQREVAAEVLRYGRSLS
jgi:LPPG:FO 2-phospho-L-lactate transferase